MTYLEAKNRLHDYIEHADEQKIMHLLSMLETEHNTPAYNYDEATLNLLRERSEAYMSGKSETSSLEESMERINAQRKK